MTGRDPDATSGQPGAARSPPAAEVPDAEDELATGARVGEYVVLRLIARGGHGSVYLAEHRVLGRRVALKVLHRHAAAVENMVARFVLEARLVNQIRHPNIVDVYDIGRLPDGRPYSVMELLAGWTLRDLLAARRRLTPTEALAVLEPTCAALAAAHLSGVIHRDVKASNVMVDEGPPLLVKLLDFGVAKSTRPELGGLTVAGQRLGTGASMAPEQILGERVDARTDVYALGVLLYQLVTGELPFGAADPAEVERLHLTAPPPRPSRIAPVPPGLDAVVARCLAKGPADRYGSATEVVAALRAALLEGAGAALAGRPAVAVHAAALTGDAASEDALFAAGEVIALVESGLRTAGYQIVLSTAEEVLGVALLPEGAAESAAARRGAVDTAHALHASASQLAAGNLRLRLVVHADEVLMRDGPAGPEVAGGPLCDPGWWAVEGDGVRVSAAVAAGG